ncbi:NAD(P)H-binding protein [Pseudomonas putida]|uniref:NAD(P)-binding domain-containing protein n=1 Tax=Pseudomonas putida TaxID=303 RepID=A0A1Q9RAD8_PSEPU|nr:NAD(P)H-binding protein [Pseudomonas putida]OLS64404.1 hypothetical protein PSEMO_06890 [Pseudomonas putida]
MHNLETPHLKLGVFNPLDSLGQALIAAALHRQHEVSALLDDLNRITARPGLRCKLGSLDSVDTVKRAVAGLEVVFACLGAEPEEDLPPQCGCLIDAALGLGDRAPRLFLLGHWQWLVNPDDSDGQAMSAGLRRSLDVSGLDWTLVEMPDLLPGLRIDDFSGADTTISPEARRALDCAEALLDEMRLGLHRQQCLRLRGEHGEQA